MTMNDFLHQLRWGEESSCICGTTRWAMIENDKEKEKKRKNGYDSHCCLVSVDAQTQSGQQLETSAALNSTPLQKTTPIASQSGPLLLLVTMLR